MEHIVIIVQNVITNTMNKPVSFEIAKLLKEKGYENEDCESVYLTDFDEEYPPEKIELSTRNLRERTIGEFDYIAPSIGDVVMWLYEKHTIWISVGPPILEKLILWEYFIQNSNTGSLYHQNFGYKNPIETYEAAIKYVLEKLI